MDANRPTVWRTKALDGDDDVGLDFMVNIVDEGQYTDIFHVQLKGSASKDPNSDDTYFSIVLSGSTVRYYEQINEPILLVFCDLSANPDDPRVCPAYWVWVHDEIERRRADDPVRVDSGISLTVRVPKAHVLNRHFDASVEIARVRKLKETGAQLGRQVERAYPTANKDERAAFAENIIGGFSARSTALVEAMSSPATSYWPEAARDSVPAKLNEVTDLLKFGKTAAAAKSLDALEPSISAANDLERAEFWYLRGKTLSLDFSEENPALLFKRAYELSKRAKHLVAWIEADLRKLLVDEHDHDFSELLDRAAGDDPDIIAMRSRLLAMMGKHAEADQLLDRLPDTRGLTQRAINALTAYEWDRVVELCSRGLSDSPGKATKGVLHLLRARAHFHRAVNLNTREELSTYVPITGPVGLDVEELRRCWADVDATIAVLADTGWPENTAFLADVWANAALFLGQAKETLPILRLAANTRRKLLPLQHALEVIAMHADEFDVALEANARTGDGGEALLRRIVLHHQAKRQNTCLKLLDENLARLPTEHPLYPTALVCGCLAADELVRPDNVVRYEALLKAIPKSLSHLASLTYARHCRTDGLPTKEAIAELGAAFKSTKDALGLGLQYLMALDADDEAGAREVVEVAASVRQKMQLPVEGELRLAQAYVTLQQWELLRQIGEFGSQRFLGLKRFAAIEAFALDKLGHSAAAKAKLADLIASGPKDRLAIQTFVRISVRSGFVEDAIGLVEQLISETNDRVEKLGHYGLLFELVGSTQPRSSRLESIAWAIGKITNQEDETEEGVFLFHFLSATVSGDVIVPEEHQNEVRARFDAYAARFPNSKIISRKSIPEKMTLDDLDQMMLEIDPDFLKRHEHHVRLEEMRERGALPVPYVWLPQRVLENIPDVPSLWAVTKHSSLTATKYHLHMADGSWRAVARSQIGSRIPLLDLPALLVINDLGLFAVLFKVFPKIAVSQSTFQELRKLTAPMAGTWGRDSSEQIIAALKTNFSNVICPSAPMEKDFGDPEDGKMAADDIKAQLGSGNFILYSDDLVFRVYANVPVSKGPTMCTLDLLSMADTMAIMTADQVGRACSQLCSWNVGIVIEERYIFASIPDSVLTTDSIPRRIDILSSDKTLGPILAGIWNIHKSMNDLINNAARMAVQQIKDERNNVDSIAAFLGVWYLKTQFHNDLAKLPRTQHILLLVGRIMHFLDLRNESTARRVWRIYRKLVEYSFGDHMDSPEYHEGTRLIGNLAARFDSQSNGQWAATFLRLGLTKNTGDSDRFEAAYVEGKDQIAAEKK